MTGGKMEVTVKLSKKVKWYALDKDYSLVRIQRGERKLETGTLLVSVKKGKVRCYTVTESGLVELPACREMSESILRSLSN